ncbi:MAG: hypothetical protein J7M26_04590 [Armatimonadetes bacterium]|nr:hypothetical protein [Armatimonadota bacterium]
MIPATRFQPQTGATIPLLAMAIIVLILCLGATIDVGRLAHAKERMQKAADLAVTSASSQVDQLSPEEVRQAALDMFAANLYPDDSSVPEKTFINWVGEPESDNAGYVYQIGPYTVTVWNPYSDPVTAQRGVPPDCTVALYAHRNVKLPFLAVVGLDETPVRVRAVSTGFPSGPCLMFAHSTDPCKVGIDWSSNGGTIHGDCHSNTRVDMSGSNHVVDGWIDYRYGYDVSGNGHDIRKGFRLGNVLDFPIHYEPSDFEPYDYYYNGSCSFPGHVIPAGVYYVKGNLHITGDDVAAGPVTFVVEGRISVVGTGHDFTAARNNVLFLSLDDSDRAIDVSAQGGQWTGLCYAPYGHIKYSASGQHIYNGGLVGDTIELTGQDFTAEGTLPPLPRFYSRLIR